MEQSKIIPNGVNEKRHSEKDLQGYALSEKSFEKCNLSTFEKLEAFPRFITKRSMARFLAKHELFKNIININGSIVECGVFNGAGLFTWAQLNNIYEPTNYTRKIIGFDTFEGFPGISEYDKNDDKNWGGGDLLGDSFDSFDISIEKINYERYLGHINNIELVKGDFLKTGEKYLEKNPQLLVSLLYLDFDLYEPTKEALRLFLPRMSKGSLVCFDELNCSNFPGETTALLESLDLNKYEIKRFTIDPRISYITL